MTCVDEIINSIQMNGGMSFDNLRIVLNQYNIEKKSTELAVAMDNREKSIKMFIVTKRVEGCSDKTIQYYIGVLRRFFSDVRCNFEQITADQIRFYIAIRSQRDKLSKVSQDNELRVLKSFFKWCCAENYIDKDPTLNVKAIKKGKKIKKPFTEIELEMLRKHAKTKRNLAIIETLYSTGCRVSELCRINKNDINGEEIIVFGKGNKERIVYLNAKAIVAIKDYLACRKDENPALFVSCRKPFSRISKGALEDLMRQIGKRAGIDKCHPHRFRRTAATIALNRGMPIEQVQKMLGHENIETTTLYAKSDIENVKISHKKYVV